MPGWLPRCTERGKGKQPDQQYMLHPLPSLLTYTVPTHMPQVAPNPELRGFTVTGANALPQVCVCVGCGALCAAAVALSPSWHDPSPVPLSCLAPTSASATPVALLSPVSHHTPPPSHHRKLWLRTLSSACLAAPSKVPPYTPVTCSATHLCRRSLRMLSAAYLAAPSTTTPCRRLCGS